MRIEIDIERRSPGVILRIVVIGIEGVVVSPTDLVCADIAR